MKKFLFLCAIFASLSLPQPFAQSPKNIAFVKTTYSNPLPVQFGDPHVLPTKGKYYMYGTGAGAKNGFSAYTSKDLVTWQALGQVFYGDSGRSWGIHSFWAREVYEIKNKYYLFYSAQWKYNPSNQFY